MPPAPVTFIFTVVFLGFTPLLLSHIVVGESVFVTFGGATVRASTVLGNCYNA